MLIERLRTIREPLQAAALADFTITLSDDAQVITPDTTATMPRAAFGTAFTTAIPSSSSVRRPPGMLPTPSGSPAATRCRWPFAAALNGQPALAIALCDAGDLEQGQDAVRALRGIGDPLLDPVGPMFYLALQTMQVEGAPDGLHTGGSRRSCAN